MIVEHCRCEDQVAKLAALTLAVSEKEMLLEAKAACEGILGLKCY